MASSLRIRVIIYPTYILLHIFHILKYLNFFFTFCLHLTPYFLIFAKEFSVKIKKLRVSEL